MIMTNIKRSAFTLIELLVGMVMMMIVIAGITMCVNLGLDLFTKSEANARVTNGVRFTIASFKSDIWPMVSRAGTVEILKAMPTNVEDSTSQDCYVYYDSAARCVKYRIANDVETLHGSEYISSLDFSMTATSNDSVDDLSINMHIEGQAEDHPAAYVSVDVFSAMLNRPEKSGNNKKGNYYTGPVLHFAAYDFRDLQVRDYSVNNKVLGNNEAVAKGDVLQLYYRVSVPAGKTDKTKLMWYAFRENTSNVVKSTGYYENSSYPTRDFTTTSGDCYWPLLIKKSDNEFYLASELYKSMDVNTDSSYLEIPTSNDSFYVYTGSKLPGVSGNGDFDENGKLVTNVNTNAKPLAKYCFLRCWVVPAYKDITGKVKYPRGTAQWSHVVRMQETGAAGQTFFNEWVQDLIDRESATGETDAQKAEHWQKGLNATKAQGYLNSVTGEYYAKVNTSDGSNAIQLTKVLRPDQLADARSYDKAVNDGKSYTCITNYSVIIDAEAGQTTAGIALLLNGYKNGNDVRGFALYYDPGANGYPIRLLDTGGHKDGYDAKGVWEIESPQQADTLVAGADERLMASSITAGNNNQKGRRFYNNYYNPQYVPAALRNNVFADWNESESSTLQNNIGDKTPECSAMQKRRRYKITLLEYYTEGKKNKPCLIVRMQLLKNLSEVLAYDNGTTDVNGKNEKQLRLEDPFLDGPEFYYSEPAWYGLFVGQTPKAEDDNTKYTFKAMGTGNINADVIRTIVGSDDAVQKKYYVSTPSYYAVQSPSSTSDIRRYGSGYSVTGSVSGDVVTKTFNGGVYAGKKLCVTDSFADSKLGTVDPSRYHVMGIGLWKGKLPVNTSTILIYGMTLAPGFDESELRSIMPSKASMFGMDDTNSTFNVSEAQYSSAEDTNIVWNETLFGSSKASNGTGNNSNGKTSNIYQERFKNASDVLQTCIMSLYHTGDSATCECPICRAYRAYQKNMIVGW